MDGDSGWGFMSRKDKFIYRIYVYFFENELLVFIGWFNRMNLILSGYLGFWGMVLYWEFRFGFCC